MMKASRIMAVSADVAGQDRWLDYFSRFLPEADASVVSCAQLHAMPPHEAIGCLLVLMDEDAPLAAALRFKMLRPQVRLILLNHLEDVRAGGLVIHEQQAVPIEQALGTLRQVIDAPQPRIAPVEEIEEDAPLISPVTMDRLSEREREILRLTAEGLSIKEIARTLNRAYGTVTRHRANLMNKLNLHDKVALTRYAIRIGLAQV